MSHVPCCLVCIQYVYVFRCVGYAPTDTHNIACVSLDVLDTHQQIRTTTYAQQYVCLWMCGVRTNRYERTDTHESCVSLDVLDTHQKIRATIRVCPWSVWDNTNGYAQRNVCVYRCVGYARTDTRNETCVSVDVWGTHQQIRTTIRIFRVLDMHEQIRTAICVCLWMCWICTNEYAQRYVSLDVLDTHQHKRTSIRVF